MALVIADRVKETTTTTGTGTINLAGAASGFQSFVSGVGNSNTTFYTIEDANGAWEIGIGTVTDASPDTLARTTVLATSNGDTSQITLSTGTHTVFGTYPAGKAVYLDASGNLSHTVDISSDTNLVGGTGITLTGDTLSTTDSEIVHDNLSGFVANEHIDWTTDQGSTNIHSGNYTDTNTMGSGFTVSATTDTNATTITEGDDLFFAAGTGIACETTADGTVTIACTVTDTNTQLSTEEVQDIAGPLVATGGTKTLITVTYDDTNGDMDFVVDNDLSNYDNSSSGFLTAHPNISAASSSDNSGRTYIQDITVDSNGHVTGIATATETVTDTNTQLSTEEVQDIAGPLVATGGTKTLISVTYDDTNGNMDFVVDNDLSNYSNSSSGFLTAHPSISAASSSDNSGRTYIQDITLDSNGHVTGIATATETVTDTNTQLSTEEVQDIAGGMFTGNTETLITATYQDADGTIDLVVDNDLSNYDNSSSGFLTAHPNISAASSSDNSGRTYIQDMVM